MGTARLDASMLKRLPPLHLLQNPSEFRRQLSRDSRQGASNPLAGEGSLFHTRAHGIPEFTPGFRRHRGEESRDFSLTCLHFAFPSNPEYSLHCSQPCSCFVLPRSALHKSALHKERGLGLHSSSQGQTKDVAVCGSGHLFGSLAVQPPLDLSLLNSHRCTTVAGKGRLPTSYSLNPMKTAKGDLGNHLL